MRGLIAAGLALLILSGGGARAAQVQLAFPEDPDLRDALRAASLTATAVAEGQEERRDIVAAAQADYRRLLAVLFENGYFGPVISITVDGVEAAALPAVGLGSGVDVVVVWVRTGPRFLFREAMIAPVAPGTELPEDFAPGQPAGTDVLRRTARAGVEAWRGIGYAKADLAAQDIVADHAADRLDARLTLAPGPRLAYGPITVTGAERVRTRQVARVADLQPGRVHDPEELRATTQRLTRTGAFSSVSIIEAESVGPDNTLPMTVAVVERLPRRFGFGAELQSEEGLSATAFWLHRNLTGYADSLRLEGQVSGLGGKSSGPDYGITLAYNRPATFNPQTDLYANAGIERLDQPNFLSDRAYAEVGARRIVSEEFQYSYGVGLEVSRTDDAFGAREFAMLSLPLETTYDRRDNRLDPRGGYFVKLGAEPFIGFRTAGTGAALDADLRGYRGFGAARGTVLAARLQIGSVVGPELDELPADTLFFSGGGGTVRGQEFQSLGVTLPNGKVVGGKSFLGLSAEVRQDVTEKIGVVGFVDFGRVSPEATFSNGDSQVGAGLGVRYDTGIGPIRLDVGLPVSGAGNRSGFSVYIGIGQAF